MDEIGAKKIRAQIAALRDERNQIINDSIKILNRGSADSETPEQAREMKEISQKLLNIEAKIYRYENDVEQAAEPPKENIF